MARLMVYTAARKKKMATARTRLGDATSLSQLALGTLFHSFEG